jgi:hypothetical protein
MEEVREVVVGGKIKPNCALVIVDFMIRHGYIDPSTEPAYHQLVTRLHRDLSL